MYQHHFTLKRFPFENTLQADELFDGAAQLEARSRIRHLLELRGIGLLTGEAGCGKTTVCRKAVGSLHTGLFRVCYVSLSTGSVLDTYNAIASEFGLPAFTARAPAYRAIRTEASRMVAESKQLPVLIIDEAHHLRNEILEELRLLTNFRMDSENRLCLLLAGLTELRRRLAMSAHESLAQRIVVRFHLGGFGRDEVGAYIEHRLCLAGANAPIFEPSAVEAIALASNGIPRRIDRMAHYALHAAAAVKARSVTTEHVAAAAAELSP